MKMKQKFEKVLDILAIIGIASIIFLIVRWILI